MHTNTRAPRLLLAAAGVVTLGIGLTGCGALDAVVKSAADAWQVTYEVTTDSEAAVPLSEVAYLDMESRTDGQHLVEASDAETRAEPAHPGQSIWSQDSIVVVGDQAQITATPPAGVTASCRILLDGKKEVAAATAAPGEPVRCEAEAPEFPKQ